MAVEFSQCASFPIHPTSSALHCLRGLAQTTCTSTVQSGLVRLLGFMDHLSSSRNTEPYALKRLGASGPGDTMVPSR